MSDESHELIRMARENYGWIGVALTFCTLLFKPARKFLAWSFGWIYRPVLVIEKLTNSVVGLTGEMKSVRDEIADTKREISGMAARLLGLETVIQKAVHSAEAANVRARMAYEDSPIGYFECDMEGKCVWCNISLAKLFRLPREKITESNGMGWIQALHPDDSTEIYKQWMDTVQHWRPYRANYRLVEGRREPLTVEATASVMKSASDQPICIWGRVIPLPSFVDSDERATA